MKITTLALMGATVLGSMSFGLGAATAAPASPAGIQAASPVTQVQMSMSERRMMRQRMMRKKMMQRKMMHRKMMKRRMMHRM